MDGGETNILEDEHQGEEQVKKWQDSVEREIRREAAEYNQLIRNGVIFSEFVSRSNGRGRKKRKRPREVRLVTFCNHTYAIGTRLTRKLEWLMKDVFPEEANRFEELSWLEAFVVELRHSERLKNE